MTMRDRGWLCLLVLVMIFSAGCLNQPNTQQPTPNTTSTPSVTRNVAKPKNANSNFGKPHISMVRGTVPILPKVKVVNFKKTIFQGPMDTNPTLDRIRNGEKVDHRNDGAFFRNRERRLPVESDREYYREFVVKVERMPFPGPQRLIIGKRGEVYYTGDHYTTFYRVNPN